MKKKAAKEKVSSSRHRPHKTAKKPGRIVGTTCASGLRLGEAAKLRDDHKEDLVEDLVSSARGVFRRHLGLDRSGKRSIGSLTHLQISSEPVSPVIAAAGIAMVGWEKSPADDWLMAPIGQVWTVDTEGRVSKYMAGSVLRGRRGDKLDRIVRLGTTLGTQGWYEFDGNGALVRTAFVDRLVPSNSDDARVVVRQAGEQRPITAGEALAAVAALLKAFATVRLSLAGDANRQVLDWLSDIASDGRSYAERLRHPFARLLRPAGSAAVEVICEQIADDADQVQSLLKGQRKKEARIWLMGPLQTCYQLLFGRLATVDVSRKNTPFIRFATAFFREVGCPCAPGAVGSALDAWRKSNRMAANGEEKRRQVENSLTGFVGEPDVIHG